MTHDDAERLSALLERLAPPGTPLPAPVAAAFPWLAAAGPRQTRAQPWYHGHSYAYGYSYEYAGTDRWFVLLDVEPPFWRRSREQVVAMLEEEIKLIMAGAA